MSNLDELRQRLARERQARRVAEALLDAKSLEVARAHRRLQRGYDKLEARIEARTRSLARLNEQFEEARSDAEAANHAKSQFLATMSHEIRTPINGVLGMLQLLLDTELAEPQREFAETARKSALALLAIVSDILDFSAIEHGGVSINETGFDLHECVDEVAQLLRPLAAQKGLELILRIAGDVPRRVVGDPVRVRQILVNLVGNAVKFTEQGAVTIVVRCAVRPAAGSTIHFMVQDTGIGIAHDRLEHIFESFTQADESTMRTYGGTGLGLTISKQLAELMGGDIDVESVVGKGSIFRLTLRLAATEETEQPEPEVQQSSGEKTEAAHPLGFRVLVVEDDPVNLRVAVHLLTRMGCHVETAVNGLIAVNMLSERTYDLVFLDCHMPEMDGFEATRTIRDLQSSVLDHAVPIVALTASTLAADHERCLAAGMTDYVTKPITAASLASAAERWARRRATTR